MDFSRRQWKTTQNEMKAHGFSGWVSVGEGRCPSDKEPIPHLAMRRTGSERAVVSALSLLTTPTNNLAAPTSSCRAAILFLSVTCGALSCLPVVEAGSSHLRTIRLSGNRDGQLLF